MTKWTWTLKKRDWVAKDRNELIEKIQRFLFDLAQAPRYRVEECVTFRKKEGSAPTETTAK